MRLRRLGYWGEPESGLPDPRTLAGAKWDPIERDLVSEHLTRGFVARAYLGQAACRLCDVSIGSLELTDGAYLWPEGLAHYVVQHDVALPQEFVQHVVRFIDAAETATVDDSWWTDAV